MDFTFWYNLSEEQESKTLLGTGYRSNGDCSSYWRFHLPRQGPKTWNSNCKLDIVIVFFQYPKNIPRFCLFNLFLYEIDYVYIGGASRQRIKSIVHPLFEL